MVFENDVPLEVNAAVTLTGPEAGFAWALAHRTAATGEPSIVNESREHTSSAPAGAAAARKTIAREMNRTSILLGRMF